MNRCPFKLRRGSNTFRPSCFLNYLRLNQSLKTYGSERRRSTNIVALLRWFTLGTLVAPCPLGGVALGPLRETRASR